MIHSIARGAVLAMTSLSLPLSMQNVANQGRDICQDQALRSTTINTVLTIRTKYRNVIQISSTETISIPAKWGASALLLKKDSSQWTAMKCFLPLDQYAYRANPPDVTYKNSHVVVTDTASNAIYPSDNYFNVPLPGNVSLGPWSVSADSSKLNVNLERSNMSVPVRWTAEVKTDGLSISRPSPTPSVEDGKGDLKWSFTSDQSRATTSISLPQRLRVDWWMWRPPIATLTDFIQLLYAGIALYFIVYWLARRFGRRSGARIGSTTAERAAKQISGFAILWLSLRVAGNYLNHLLYTHNVPQRTIAFPDTLAAAAFSVIFFLNARKLRRDKRLFIFALYAAIPAVLIFFVSVTAPSWHSFAALPLELIPLALEMFLFYAGVILWACRLWGLLVKSPGLASADLTKFQLRISYISSLTLTLLSMANLLITSNRDFGHWYALGSPISRFKWVMVSSVYQGQFDWLGGGLPNDLMRYLVVIAFFAVLRMASLDYPDVFFPGRGSLELTSMALILGALFFAWNNFAAWPVPIAAALLVLGFRYLAVTNSGTPSVARGMTIDGGEGGSGKLLAENRMAFFNAAEKISDLNYQLTALEKTDLTADAIAVRRTEIRGEINRLNARIPIAGSRYIVLPRRYDPARILLDAGPKCTWWQNGIQSVVAAVPLILLASAYSIYVSVNSGGIVWLQYPFSIPDAFIAIFGLILGWMVLAFMFGASLPYIRGSRGPVKGLCVGLVHMVALGILVWVLRFSGEGVDPRYLSEILVFILFLAILGVVVDAKTLSEYGASSGLFGRLYRLSSTRAVVTYLAAILVIGLGIWQQANVFNHAAQQRAQVGQQVIQNINSLYGSGLGVP